MAYRETEKTRLRKTETRERIVASALALVAQHGFRRVAMSDVAGEAGVATGSVYRHFPSKEALFSAVFRIATQREVDKVAEATQAPGCPRQRLTNAIDVFARRAFAGPQMAWALIAEPVDPLVEADRLYYRRAYAEHFAALIDEGTATGAWPAQNAAVCSAALVGALAETLVGPLAPLDDAVLALLNSRTITPNEVIHRIQQFCLNALIGPEITLP